MTISFTDLFTRLGRVFSADNDLSIELANEISPSVLAMLRQGLSFQATHLLIEMVHADTPLPTKDLQFALEELIRQMAAGTETVKGPTISAPVATAASGNTGNGKVVVATSDVYGRSMDTLRSEDIAMECIGDLQNKGTSGSELWSVKGEASISPGERAWPQGSGIDAVIIGSTGQLGGPPHAGGQPGRNILRNGGLDRVTTHVPDGWALITGTASTHLQEETSNTLLGGRALKFIGDGSTNIKLEQTLNAPTSTTGTPGRLQPLTRYVLSFALRHDGTPPGAGVISLSIKDGSNNIISSGGFVLTQTLSLLSGTYTIVTGTVLTPAVLPSGLKAVIETTTAITNGRSIYVDELVIAPMHLVAPGGPFMAVIPGSTPFVLGDKFSVAMANNRGPEDTDAGKFGWHFDRAFDMYARGLVLPSTTGSPSIAENLIT